MKDISGNNGGGGEGGLANADDEDKTNFERFLDKFKISIFNVLYVLLDDEEGSNCGAIVAIVIEFVEICHFSFAEDVSLP